MKMPMTMTVKRRRLVGLVFIVCLGAIWGCGSRTVSPGVPTPPTASRPPEPEPERVPPTPAEPAPTPAPAAADCRLIPEPGEPIATVALTERVDPANAPHPTNESERLLFRQLYETLVRLDCEGDMQPGLAESWQLDASRSVWTVTLRDNARFSDGTPVTATDVAAAWTIAGSSELRPQVLRLIRSAAVIDDQTLEIALRSHGETPAALAHADLAIARRTPATVWPLGTRSARIALEGGTSVLTLNRDTGNLPSIRFLLAPGRDVRDLLDEGVDLLLTRDMGALNYAATLPQFASVPLEWQRTHVLLTPGRAPTSGSPAPEALEALARDAVRGEARGAAGPFWWQSLPGCGPTPSSEPPDRSSVTDRIIYDAADSTARDLAERLVGLARASGADAAAVLDALLPNGVSKTLQRATGLSGEALASARRRGNDAGYIMALDRRPLDPCRDMQVLAESAGWAAPENIVPLVDTRLKAIVRRGHSGIRTDWDGGLLIVDSER
jgi:hypothetical protein